MSACVKSRKTNKNDSEDVPIRGESLMILSYERSIGEIKDKRPTSMSVGINTGIKKAKHMSKQRRRQENQMSGWHRGELRKRISQHKEECWHKEESRKRASWHK